MRSLKPPISVKCSACNKGLFVVYVIDEQAKDLTTGKIFSWNIKSNCPYCGDRSFIKKINGDYRVDGYYKPQTPENPETFVDDVETEDENVTLRIEKCTMV